jgi:hypothetical protein
MALFREDYRADDDVFIVRRSISARKAIERTKTSQIHYAPCVDAFKPYLDRALKGPVISHFLFTHNASKLPGKPYSHYVLKRILQDALKACDEAPMSVYNEFVGN